MASNHGENSGSPMVELSAELAARRERRENRPCPWRNNMRRSGTWDDLPANPPDNYWREVTPPTSTQTSTEDASDREVFTILSAAIKIPFPKEHRFTNELHNTVYDMCKEFVVRVYLKGSVPHDGHEWELDTWMGELLWHQERYAFLPPGITYADLESSCYATVKIRHSWTHREDVPTDTIFEAMKLGCMLQDRVRSRHILDLYTSMMTPSANIVEELFPDAPLRFSYQVLGRVETVLSRLLFDLWRKTSPDELGEHAVPEGREWRQYADKFAYTYLPQDEFPDPARNLFGNLLRDAQQIRNDHAHKNNPVHFHHRINEAIQLAIMLGDRILAIRLEVLGEQWMRQLSQKQVLQRLRHEFLSYDLYPASADKLRFEYRRRCAIAAVLIDYGFKLSETELEDLANFTAGDQQRRKDLMRVSTFVYSEQMREAYHRDRDRARVYWSAPEESRRDWAWSPSMHVLLKTGLPWAECIWEGTTFSS